MPFYKYKCEDCGLVQEVLHRWTGEGGNLKPRKEDIYCGHEECFDPDNTDNELKGCGGKVYKMLTAGASFYINTSACGDAYYSRDLGMVVKNRAHEDKIAESRGLRRINDVGEERIEKVLEARTNEMNQHQSDIERVKAGEKLEEVFSVSRMKKDGLLNDNINGD